MTPAARSPTRRRQLRPSFTSHHKARLVPSCLTTLRIHTATANRRNLLLSLGLGWSHSRLSLAKVCWKPSTCALKMAACLRAWAKASLLTHTKVQTLSLGSCLMKTCRSRLRWGRWTRMQLRRSWVVTSRPPQPRRRSLLRLAHPRLQVCPRCSTSSCLATHSG